MTEHHFDTPEPVTLAVDLGAGHLVTRTGDDATTTVIVTGRDPDRVRVDQTRHHISIRAPRRGGLLGDQGYDVTVTLPADSNVAARTGSADVRLEGRYDNLRIKTGSGAIEVEEARGAALLATGAGAIRIDDARGPLKLSSGSGDISVGAAAATLTASTGSGDIDLGALHAVASIKTGSGSAQVGEARGEVHFSTGSGSLEVRTITAGKVTGRTASGDVRIGVPTGVPVWTDVSTISGTLSSTLPPVGEPSSDAEHVEVRARTASGDVVLSPA